MTCPNCKKAIDDCQSAVMKMLDKERMSEVFCVLTGENDWVKGKGFIYRNLLGVYDDIDKAKRLVKRFTIFMGGEWRKISDEEWHRENDKIYIIKLNLTKEEQIFDYNH